MSEAVKHDDDDDDVYDDGGDGNASQSQGVGIDIPWDCSRLHERYEVPGASASGASYG